MGFRVSPLHAGYHHSQILLMKPGLDWKTDRNDVGYVLHALNSSTQQWRTHKLHPYLPGHTYAESDCQSALPNHSPGNAASICRKKILFFIFLFRLFVSSFAGITPHQPISTTYLFHRNDQVKAEKKKSFFSPRPTPLLPLFMFRPKINER